MTEYIEREAASHIIDYAKQLTSGTYGLLSGTGKACYDGIMAALDMCKRLINEAVIASDVQPVVDTENMATVSDEFICQKCGIYLKDYVKVVMDEDNDGYIDEQHYEYEPKYCPECGAEVRDGDANA